MPTSCIHPWAIWPFLFMSDDEFLCFGLLGTNPTGHWKPASDCQHVDSLAVRPNSVKGSCSGRNKHSWYHIHFHSPYASLHNGPNFTLKYSRSNKVLWWSLSSLAGDSSTTPRYQEFWQQRWPKPYVIVTIQDDLLWNLEAISHYIDYHWLVFDGEHLRYEAHTDIERGNGPAAETFT